MTNTTMVLAILVTTTIGCEGQVRTELAEEVTATSMAAVPFNLGLSTYLNNEPTKIAYDVDSRFILNVTKETLHAAKTIYDIVPADPEQEIVSYSSVSIRIFADEKHSDIVEIGDGPELTAAQLELLHNMDYSTSFVIRADFKEKVKGTDHVQKNYFSPHLTIVPEKEAANSGGKDALLAHVKAGTSSFGYRVEKDKLRAGKVCFTVNEEGEIADVLLSTSSGYPALDERVMELVRTIPGSWEPATNAAGEKVEQEFVFSFGTAGC